jgi:hypothetical protein
LPVINKNEMTAIAVIFFAYFVLYPSNMKMPDSAGIKNVFRQGFD